MHMIHPMLPASQVVEVREDIFEAVWAHRGWVEAPDLPDMEGLTVTEVLDEVGDDPTAAALALERERSSRNRSTLTAALERIAQPDQAGDGQDTPEGDN